MFRDLAHSIPVRAVGFKTTIDRLCNDHWEGVNTTAT